MINILYTSSWLGHEMKKVLDPLDISWQQFNILRILKGQKGKPASLKVLTERMIDKTSNTSRLIDKLVKKDLVERTYCPKDRRQLEITLTKYGMQVVEQASREMDHQMDALFDHMTENKLELLSTLLDEMRKKEINN